MTEKYQLLFLLTNIWSKMFLFYDQRLNWKEITLDDNITNSNVNMKQIGSLPCFQIWTVFNDVCFNPKSFVFYQIKILFEKRVSATLFSIMPLGLNIVIWNVRIISLVVTICSKFRNHFQTHYDFGPVFSCQQLFISSLLLILATAHPACCHLAGLSSFWRTSAKWWIICMCSSL